MNVTVDPVPAVLESEATGEIKVVFDDIKALTGVGVVNLVWRRLAFTKGALPAVWTMLRPLYTTGLLNFEARRFRANLELPKISKITEPELIAAGVDTLGRRTIKDILRSYNRTNSLNLISLQGALSRLKSEVVCHETKIEQVTEQPLPPLPPLPSMTVLDPQIKTLVESLNSMCEEDDQIVASMYRHLAYWPGYLALIKVLLQPAVDTGEIKFLIDKVRHNSALQAAHIASHLEPIDTGLDQSVLEDIRAVLTLFTRHPLSKMVVICGMLLAATVQSEKPTQ